MRSFKDKDGGLWKIDLPFGAIIRVKLASAGRFNLIDPAIREELTQDEGVFWEVLWYLIEPQAKEREVSAEKFGELMAADCIHEARQIFLEAWADFFRQLHRLDKAATVELAARMLNKAMALAAEKLASPAMEQAEARAEHRMRESLNAAFGSLLASSDSTPAASPGESLTA